MSKKPLLHPFLEKPVIPKYKTGVCIVYFYVDMNSKDFKSLKAVVLFVIRSDLKTWTRDAQNIQMLNWCYYEELNKAWVEK